jgi:hypothetical protein
VTVDELHELGIDEGTARMVRHGLARHRELRGR